MARGMLPPSTLFMPYRKPPMAIIGPTERSNSPAIISIVMPMVITPVIVAAFTMPDTDRMVKKLGKRLKLPSKFINYAEKLTRLHLRPIALAQEGVTDSAVRRLIVQTGDELDDLITLCRADITSQNPNKVSEYMGNFDRVVKLIKEVNERDRMRAFQSPVRGEEIMQFCQLQPGPKVGYIKRAIEEAILQGEIENTHAAARRYLEQHKERLLRETAQI